MSEETLVYDKQLHHAHCLNRLAGVVWRHCDGQRSKEDLASILNRQLGVPADPDLVELALQELAQAGLLQATAPVSAELTSYTRRAVGRKLGGAVAAFLLAPLVTSIVTQSAIAQASPRSSSSTSSGTGTTSSGTTAAPGTTSAP